MDWKKKGLIYRPPMDGSWKDNSALTPTAFILDENTIRVFVSFRDTVGTGRIGYVDLDITNPSKIIKVSQEPVLEIGRPGMFDDNGVILGDVLHVNNKIFMYYIGFQLVENVKFLAYTGLAISSDQGETFHRYKETPVLDRQQEAIYIRALHSIIYEAGTFKAWYATGNGWENIKGINYPQYDINYIESKDGINFCNTGTKCIENIKDNHEYRIGRPRVYKNNDNYIMNFTYGTTDGRYQAGQASSDDGIIWQRDDTQFGLKVSESGWDSLHLSYPSVVTTKTKSYMFYNGNYMGKDGFGYAETNI